MLAGHLTRACSRSAVRTTIIRHPALRMRAISRQRVVRHAEAHARRSNSCSLAPSLHRWNVRGIEVALGIVVEVELAAVAAELVVHEGRPRARFGVDGHPHENELAVRGASRRRRRPRIRYRSSNPRQPCCCPPIREIAPTATDRSNPRAPGRTGFEGVSPIGVSLF
jgi:hypothetical protein